MNPPILTLEFTLGGGPLTIDELGAECVDDEPQQYRCSYINCADYVEVLSLECNEARHGKLANWQPALISWPDRVRLKRLIRKHSKPHHSHCEHCDRAVCECEEAMS